MKKITSVADLIGIIRTAHAGGQFATIEGEHNPKFNVMPNEDYCKAHNITLASGKGSKAINEPYRFNGLPYTYRFKVAFHFDQDYDRTLAKMGLSRSADGSTATIDHFGGPIKGFPNTLNICFEYMQGNYSGDGYYLNGKRIEDTETLDYIKGYKSVSKSVNPTEYRNIGYRNIRFVNVAGETYKVEIPNTLTQSEYDALCTAFGAKRTEPTKPTPTNTEEYTKVG